MGQKDKQALRRRRKPGAGMKSEEAVKMKREHLSDREGSSSWLSWPILRILFRGAILVVVILLLVRRTQHEDGEDAPHPVKQHRNLNSFEILQVYDHDPGAFTQGLTFAGGKLYEGTGNHGASELRIVDVQKGTPLVAHKLKAEFFGEGIAHFVDGNGKQRIIQLTYRTRKGFIYTADTLRPLREFDYETVTNEGWGISYNPQTQEFIISDGSAWLFFWDRDTLQEKRRIQVMIPASLLSPQVRQQHPGRSEFPVRFLNELEWDRGTLLANVWMSSYESMSNLEWFNATMISALCTRNPNVSSLLTVSTESPLLTKRMNFTSRASGGLICTE